MSEPHHIYNLTVLEKHIDTFGHVNNATYLEILEEARWDWITKNGYGVYKIQSTGLGPVVLEISISFRKEIKLRQAITIESFLVDYRMKIAKIRQQIRDEQKSICCSAEFTFGLFDLKSRKLVMPTDDWLAALRPVK
jgi:thioesterase III